MRDAASRPAPRFAGIMHVSGLVADSGGAVRAAMPDSPRSAGKCAPPEAARMHGARAG